MSLQFPITIKIIYEPEAKDAPYVAYIPEFDISSAGKTEQKARKNVKEALEILLEEAKRKNKLNELLIESGMTIENTTTRPKLITESFHFTI